MYVYPGRGRVAGAMIGSVARAVLQSSMAPMLAVGPQADRPPLLVGRPRRRPGSWPKPLSVRRLVACVDGSAASEAVLPVATQWAKAFEMSLTTSAKWHLQRVTGAIRASPDRLGCCIRRHGHGRWGSAIRRSGRVRRVRGQPTRCVRDPSQRPHPPRLALSWTTRAAHRWRRKPKIKSWTTDVPNA